MVVVHYLIASNGASLTLAMSPLLLMFLMLLLIAGPVLLLPPAHRVHCGEYLMMLQLKQRARYGKMCPAAVRRRRQRPCEIAVVVVILDVISRCKIINSLTNDGYPQCRAAPKRIRLTTSSTKHTPSGPLNLRGQVIDHNKMKSALFMFLRRRRRRQKTHSHYADFV